MVLAEVLQHREHRAHQGERHKVRHYHGLELCLGERSPIRIRRKKEKSSKPEIQFIEQSQIVEVQVPEAWRLQAIQDLQG